MPLLILMLFERERKLLPVDPADVNIDYVLDERMRELIIEEPRRRTLVRLHKMYERTMKYNYRVKNNMQPYHELWPIPQKAIDANTAIKIEQNPGLPRCSRVNNTSEEAGVFLLPHSL